MGKQAEFVSVTLASRDNQVQNKDEIKRSIGLFVFSCILCFQGGHSLCVVMAPTPTHHPKTILLWSSSIFVVCPQWSFFPDDNDEVMLNVLRCQLTY